MKNYLFTCFLSLIIISCTKENDMGILKGDIIGKVNLLDQYGYLEKDMSGTKVTISGTDFSETATTDELGYYKFQNLPFGIYSTTHEHNGYLERNQEKIKHIGGTSPTLSFYHMDQLPAFEVQLDSIVKEVYDYYAYGKMLNINNKPQYGYGFAFRFFISNNDQVSKENFTSSTVGYGVLTTGTNIRIRVDWYSQNNGLFYLRAYPLITYHYHSLDLLKGIGKPSNVISIKVPK